MLACEDDESGAISKLHAYEKQRVSSHILSRTVTITHTTR
jgi:hypothetical protein